MIDRIPPNSVEAETAVLSAMFLDHEAVLKTIQIVNQSDFYVTKHQIIYMAFMELVKKDIPADMVTIIKHLRDSGNLEKAGGTLYITDLAGSSPSAANIQYYANIVKDKSNLRTLLTALNEGVNGILSNQVLNDVVGNVTAVIDNIMSDDDSGFRHAKDFVERAFEKIDALREKKIKPGLPTGFGDYDRLLNGYYVGLHILAARPSHGKTAWILNQICNMIINGFAVGFVSLETDGDKIMLRMLSNMANVLHNKISVGNLDKDEYNKLAIQAGKLLSSKLFIDDSAKYEAQSIIAKCKMLHKTRKLDILFVDHLQLMRDKTAKTRNEETGGISASLKGLSKSLQIPVVVLCQLNRSGEKKMPGMDHLRDSGEIEANADSVTFLYRPEQAGENNYEGRPADGLGVFRVAKNREGKTGGFELSWQPDYVRFVGQSKHTEEECPF